MSALLGWLHRHLVFAIAGWGFFVAMGVVALFVYKGRPGSDGRPSLAWPEGSTLVRASDRPTLLMFVHPDCPCTRASVEELAVIVDRADVSVRAVVVVMSPKGTEATGSSGVVERAGSLPQVEVVFDADGVEAARFGAETSGHVLVFSEEGRRLYSGGITGSRGHQGDNAGRARVLALLTQGPPDGVSAHVFGCALGNDT